MNVTEKYFRLKRFDKTKLISFGFSDGDKELVYRKKIADGQMDMRVCVKDGRIFSEVYDCDTGDEYTLHAVDGTSGEFVGRVRRDFEKVLSDIAERCCEDEAFHSDNARLLREYARNRYGTELEFLWDRLPDAAVLRRSDNKKWYAVLMTVKGEKLGLSQALTEIIDVRALPEEIDSAVDGENYFRGYHMNKKHWLTLRLDGTVGFKEIVSRLDESYLLADGRGG